MKTLFLLNIMLHIPKNNDYLEILTNEKANDFLPQILVNILNL